MQTEGDLDEFVRRAGELYGTVHKLGDLTTLDRVYKPKSLESLGSRRSKTSDMSEKDSIQMESGTADRNEKSPLIRPDSGEPTDFYTKYVQPCIVEFIGTTLFVFIGVMSAQQELTFSVAVSHGFTIALLVIAFGKISGGHFNPAVTFGVTLAGGLKPILTIFYILVQLFGGIFGAALTRGCLSITPSGMDAELTNETVYTTISGGTQTLGENVSVSAGVLTEIILTFLLVTTVIHSAVDTRSSSVVQGIAIGFAVVVDIQAGGLVTGASMNPARSFGPALMYSDISMDQWKYHWIYWIAPTIGAFISGLMYRIFTAANDRRCLFKDKTE